LLDAALHLKLLRDGELVELVLRAGLTDVLFMLVCSLARRQLTAGHLMELSSRVNDCSSALDCIKWLAPQLCNRIVLIAAIRHVRVLNYKYNPRVIAILAIVIENGQCCDQ